MDQDINYRAYLKFKSDKDWFKQNKGKWVAFCDGKLIATGQDREKLLRRSELRGKKSVFYIQVTEHLRVVHV